MDNTKQKRVNTLYADAIIYRDAQLLQMPPADNEEELSGIISGVAILFDEEAEVKPGVFERVKSTAVDNALLRGDDVRCLFNHDVNYVIGRSTAGNLRLWKEDDGLHFEVQIDPLICWQRDLCRQIAAGMINQCSFGFGVDKKTVTEDDDGNILVSLDDLTLYDVSVVTYPAYEDTSAEARSRSAQAEMPREQPELELMIQEIELY